MRSQDKNYFKAISCVDTGTYLPVPCRT